MDEIYHVGDESIAPVSGVLPVTSSELYCPGERVSNVTLPICPLPIQDNDGLLPIAEFYEIPSLKDHYFSPYTKTTCIEYVSNVHVEEDVAVVFKVEIIESPDKDNGIALIKENNDSSFAEMQELHKSTVLYRMNIVVGSAITCVYYGALLYASPVPTVVFLALTGVRQIDYVDQQCNRIGVFGINVCDIGLWGLGAYVSLSGGEIFVERFFSHLVKNKAMKLTIKTCAQVAISSAQHSLSWGSVQNSLPGADDYLSRGTSNYVKEMTKIGLKSVVPDPVAHVASIFAGQCTKVGFEIFKGKDVSLQTLGAKTFRNSLCKKFFEGFGDKEEHSFNKFLSQYFVEHLVTAIASQFYATCKRLWNVAEGALLNSEQILNNSGQIQNDDYREVSEGDEFSQIEFML